MDKVRYTLDLTTLKGLLLLVVLAVAIAFGTAMTAFAGDPCEEGGGEGCCPYVGQVCTSTNHCGDVGSPCGCNVFTNNRCTQL